GTCKIVDFGIAATRASLQNAGDGQFAGKLAYMAPEQVLGHELDLRADIFALGIVLYEMCLARRLFRGLPEEVAERIVEGDIPAPTFVKAEFPPALEAIIMKALEVDPAERYQNCDHMFRDLEKFTEQAGIRCTPRMISAYMSEMFGEGAPAEVNYDDQYDDLVDEALDFDKFDSLEAAKSDDAPEWARSIESQPDTSGVRNKKSMTIGNLEALLGPEFQQLRQQHAEATNAAAAAPAPPEPDAAGGARRKKAPRDRVVMPRLEPEPPATGPRKGPATTRPPIGPAAAASPKQSSTQLGRVPTAGRPTVRPGQSMTTGALSALDTGATAGSFGHGVMAEQNKKGGAALTWLLVILGLGGLGYIAYTVFTMK
ncbi:MAG: protein kinase, partial [Myxococcales bacterium]|nr:protein kinase [Myxococcales bacterium]